MSGKVKGKPAGKKPAPSGPKVEGGGIMTRIDEMMRLVEAKKSVSRQELAKRTGWSVSIVEKVGKVLEKTGNFGFNAQTEEYCDMVAEGIMDPTKVVRIALQDAASVAALLITTEAMVAEAPKKDAGAGAMPAMPGGGMGGMGGMDF